MVTHDEAVALAAALPNVTEGTIYGNRGWRVGAKVRARHRRVRAEGVAVRTPHPSPTPTVGVHVGGPGRESPRSDCRR